MLFKAKATTFCRLPKVLQIVVMSLKSQLETGTEQCIGSMHDNHFTFKYRHDILVHSHQVLNIEQDAIKQKLPLQTTS